MRIGRCAVMSDWGLRFRVLMIPALKGSTET
jgi:hypothetical protein